MKIGIITTHYALNYGAFLQALALQRIISGLGYDCEIINYQPKIKKYGRDYFRKIQTFKDLLAFLFRLVSVNSFIKFNARKKKFDTALKNEMNTSNRVYTSYDEILKNLEYYDCFICGSDQIWNINLMYDPTFFLDFHQKYPSAKYIAYGPSISMSKITEDAKNLYRKHLAHFNALSVRELTGKSQLSSLIGKEIKVVLDPVFLYGADNWENFSKLPKDVVLKEPYILCFFIGTNNLSKIAVEKVRKLIGFNLVYCNLQLRDRFHSDLIIRDASPQEFVGLIKNASFICTNSFHATAFSIIFQKPFITTLNQNGRDSRMVDLLTTIGLNDRMYDLDNIYQLDQNSINKCFEGYNLALPLLEHQITESINYLEKSFI